MKIAFIIIDVQNGYIESPHNQETYNYAKLYINHVSSLFRTHKMPVIHVRHMAEDADPNLEALQISKEINQEDEDYHIIKHVGNSFYNTDLEDILRNEEVDFVLLSGLSAIRCVLATYNGANERKFKVAMLKHGLIGEPKQVEVVEDGFSIVSHDVVEYLLKQMTK